MSHPENDKPGWDDPRSDPLQDIREMMTLMRMEQEFPFMIFEEPTLFFGGHTEDCGVQDKPTKFFMSIEIGDDHCTSCHCTCDPEGPTCNHWIGCPGC